MNDNPCRDSFEDSDDIERELLRRDEHGNYADDGISKRWNEFLRGWNAAHDYAAKKRNGDVTSIAQRLRDRCDINKWHDAGLIDTFQPHDSRATRLQWGSLTKLILEAADLLESLERENAELSTLAAMLRLEKAELRTRLEGT